MGKKRYFMDNGGDHVYTLDVFKDWIDGDIRSEIYLEEMKRDYGGPMWCQWHDGFVEQGDCGKLYCDEYSPCNSKSGRCRHLKNGFIGTGRFFKLTKYGLAEVDHD